MQHRAADGGAVARQRERPPRRRTITGAAVAAVLVAGVLAVGGVPRAAATTFTPNNVEQLRSNVVTSNINGQNDIIELGGNTFTLTSQLVVNADGGNSLTFRGPGTLQSSGTDRVVLVNTGANAVFQEVTIRGGNSDSSGGAVLNQDGRLTILRSTITGNRAVFGGAFRTLAAGQTRVVNSTLSNNSARFGGGFDNGGGFTSLSFTTITRNRSDLDGGGFRNLAGTTSIDGSIVAGNVANRDHPDCSGEVDSGGYNVIGDDTGCNGFDSTGDVEGDPQLRPLLNNGGSTLTHAILDTSIAFDRRPQATGCPGTDQRNVSRPQGDACDSGSFELEVDDDAPPPPPPPPGGDDTPPDTEITSGPSGATPPKPGKLPKTTKARPEFTFASNESGSTFQCSVDGGAFASCSSLFKIPSKLSRGKPGHSFAVRAIDAAGNTDPTPASIDFIVKNKRRRR